VVNNLIYIERKIRIKNNEAQIEEPIILYKGDMNIELQFIIENNPFKYKPGMDVTYGQLVIKRPNAAPIFSEPAKMSSSRVLFIITGDMIDELVELGDYDFQIRLLNTDQTSRGTLPPITAGITIKEPLCEEAITNRASVNDANAYVMRANNNVMRAGNSDNAFDADGNYNRTNWVGGDIITDTKLNKVEEALYQINNDIPTDYATEEYVDDSVRSTRDYVIDNYATTSYVDSAIEAIDVDVDLTGYATEEFVAESIRNSGHATESYVDSAVSSSQGQIEDYIANKYVSNSDIEDYATKDYVGEAIDNIKIPDTDLTGYATEAYVDQQIEANSLDIMEIGSDDPNNRYIFTGNEFSDEDYRKRISKSVLLKNTNINFDNGAFCYFENELVYIELGGHKKDKEFTIYRPDGITMHFSVIDGGFTLLGKKYLATESYVDNAIANIEGGGSSSLDIMTIGNDDGSEYYFTGNEFTDEEYNLSASKPALLKNVVVDGKCYYNELVHIQLGRDGNRIFTIYSPKGSEDHYLITGDGIVTCTQVSNYATTETIESMLDKRNYATQDYVDKQIANIEVSGGADLTGYATEQYVIDYVGEALGKYATQDDLDNMLGDIDSILGGI
jgi:hypothetical protein